MRWRCTTCDTESLAPTHSLTAPAAGRLCFKGFGSPPIGLFGRLTLLSSPDERLHADEGELAADDEQKRM